MNRVRARERTCLVFALVFAATLGAAGCNILSWTHDAGGSTDPEILLQDAEDALLDREYEKALEYADKGIANDPPPIRFPRLRYVATQALLAKAGISIQSYLNAFTNKPGFGKNDPEPDQLAESILDLTIEELRAIASNCPQAVAYLVQILDALEAGDVVAEDLPDILFDVEVGYGMAKLLTAFVTILDVDQDLTQFDQDPDVTIETLPGGGYFFDYAGPNPETYVPCVLFCPLRECFCLALEAVYDAYRAAKGIAEPQDLQCDPLGSGPGTLPAPVDTSLLIGEVLEFVHSGISELYVRYGADCGSCPAQGGGK